jgi:hypothetical protein
MLAEYSKSVFSLIIKTIKEKLFFRFPIFAVGMLGHLSKALSQYIFN